MRDVLVLTLFAALVPVALFRPIVGALLFLCLSVMNPHRLTWGTVSELPLAHIAGIATLIGCFLSKDRNFAGALRQYWLMIVYVIWTGITTTAALSPESANFRFFDLLKIHLMVLVTLALVTDRQKLYWLVFVCVGSVAFFGIKGGVFTIATGGAFIVWGPPNSNIEENNALAVALLMFVPVLIALRTWTERGLVRAGLLVAAGLCLLSALGSQSRGALLACLSLLVTLWWRSRNRLSSGILILVCVAAIVPFLPDHWWQRMGTIAEYEEDGSAMGRVYAWTTAINIANARLTGGGFDYYGPAASAVYGARPTEFQAAHSIYFQALGEHGWIGLTLFLAFWLFLWIKSRRLVGELKRDESWKKEAALVDAVSVGIVAYAVGGAFIQFGNWDGAYYYAAIVMACDLVKARCAATAAKEVGVGAQNSDEGVLPTFTLPALRASPRTAQEINAVEARKCRR